MTEQRSQGHAAFTESKLHLQGQAAFTESKLHLQGQASFTESKLHSQGQASFTESKLHVQGQAAFIESKLHLQGKWISNLYREITIASNDSFTAGIHIVHRYTTKTFFSHKNEKDHGRNIIRKIHEKVRL